MQSERNILEGILVLRLDSDLVGLKVGLLGEGDEAVRRVIYKAVSGLSAKKKRQLSEAMSELAKKEGIPITTTEL